MEEIKVGDILIGKVTGIKKYGVFVKILNYDIAGMIHISELDSTYIKNIRNYVKIDEKILVKVLGRDGDRLNLSIKDMNYKTKKHCINLSEPLLRIDEDEFDVLKTNMKDWIN
ncbi:MAG: S1 RNA-binding domain-containing protein [Bacilli bacterium]